MTAGLDNETSFRTFLFTDIEESTFMWERHADLMSAALLRHDELVFDAIEQAGGEVCKHLGDGVSAVFRDGESAIEAAIAMQSALGNETWPEQTPIGVRIGIHHGIAEKRRGDYFGRAVNCAARIVNAGAGGQILISRSLHDQLAPGELDFRTEGYCQLKGISQPVELLTVLAAGLPHDFGHVTSPYNRTSHIPVALDHIIGRQRELEDIDALVANHRVVTLVGPPGTGKTRLAIEVANRATTSFDDGVHMVELGSIEDPADIEEAVAQVALGVDPIARSGTAIARLEAALGSSKVLFVLDNCEHLSEPIGQFVRTLLTRVPTATVLATSREPLGMFGEHRFEVEPLATEADHGLAPAQHLFLQRARQARPDLRDLDPRVVLDICERLDGLPLAIELAAARLNVLALGELAEKLHQVLGSGRRSRRVDRHETLEAAIEWSWEMLDDDERMVLVRASAFAAGFDFDAATDVCGGDEFDAVDVIDLIASLRDRSFLSTVYDESGNRFRLLQVIRQFIQRRGEPAELAAAAGRHQEYFLRITAPLAAQLDQKPDRQLIASLERDDPNFLAALRERPGWSVGSARKLAMQLHTYWEETGRLADGFEITRRLLEPNEPGSGLWRAVLGVAVSYGAMTGHLNEIEQNEAMLSELVGGEPDIRALNAYFGLGFVKLGRAELAEAADWFETAASVAAPFDGGTQRQALMTAGACHAYDDRPDVALGLYRTAREVPPPAQGWFDDYATVFELAADVQADPHSDRVANNLSAIDRSLTELADRQLGFRVTVAVHQSAVAFEETNSSDLLGYWWPVGLRLARNNGHRWAAALAIEIAGWASARTGDEAGAIRHWAVSDGAFAESGFALPAVHKRLSARQRDSVRDRVGAVEFDREYNLGVGTDLAVHLERL